MIISVDPGSSGAICAMISKEQFKVVDTPSLKKESMIEFKEDFIDYCKFVSHIFFEAQYVQSTDGGDRILSYGQTGGRILGILKYCFPDAEIIEVHPVTWKAHFKLNLKKDKTLTDSENTKRKKEYSAQFLSRYLSRPFTNMYGKMGGLKDGRVDAILIGLYGLDYLKGAAKLPLPVVKKKIKRKKNEGQSDRKALAAD